MTKLVLLITVHGIYLLEKILLLRVSLHYGWHGINDGKVSRKKKILQETGWFLAPDGKWRYEIGDSEIKVNRLKTLLKGSVTEVSLKEVLEHDALYQAYPSIGDIKIRFAALPKGNTGRYSEARNQILLDYKLALNDKLTKQTLIHEIQHAIQHIEGFALGGSKTTAATYLFNENYDRYKNTPEALNATSWRELQEAILQHTANAMGYKNISNMLDNSYASLLGEAEARASASRLNATAEERGKQYPAFLGYISIADHDHEEQRMKQIALNWKQTTGIDVPQKLAYDVSGGVHNEANHERKVRSFYENREKTDPNIQENEHAQNLSEVEIEEKTNARGIVGRSEIEKGTNRAESDRETHKYNQGDVTGHTNELYSIAGRNAATANLEALGQAEDLEVNGYNPGEIYRETGWFRVRMGSGGLRSMTAPCAIHRSEWHSVWPGA